MTDAVQLPPSLPVVPRVAPVRAAEHVEPPKKPQTENHNSSDQRQQQERAAEIQRAISNEDRHMRISRDDATRSFVYRSVEADSGEIVWQYPAEQIIRRAHYLRAEEQKHAVDERA